VEAGGGVLLLDEGNCPLPLPDMVKGRALNYFFFFSEKKETLKMLVTPKVD
jgi:hypothetical protein